MSSPQLKDKKKDKDKDSKEKDAKRRKAKTITPQVMASEAHLTNTESAAVLNNIFLPVIAKRPSSDKLAQLASLLTALESESPGFASEFAVDLVKRFEQEQRSLSPLGVQVVVNSTKEEYSDLTKFLLSRWRAKTDVPTASQAADDGDHFM